MKSLATFALLGLLLVPCIAGAAPLNVTIPCASGSLVVNGDYTAPNFTFTATLNNCSTGLGVLTGTTNSSGTFVFTSGSTAIVNASITTHITSTSGGASLTDNCTITFSGTYNLGTLVLSGNHARNCSGSGSGVVDLVQLLTGVELE